MIKQLKQFTLNLIAGANVATVLVMLATGYADHIYPPYHPLLSVLGLAFPIFLLINLCFLLFWIIFKWRRIWIPVAGYILAYVPITTYLPMNPRQEVPEGCIKLLSYNVCTYGGNYKYKDAFERIVDYLDEQQADIVCLQEDADSWRKYTFQRFQKIYPHNDTTVFCKKESLFNAVGIHTRYPILRKERIPYESKTNGSVAYFLKVDNDTLLVINNHFEGTHLSKKDRSNYKEMLRGDMQRDTARIESKHLIERLGKSAAQRALEADAVSRYIDNHRQYPTIVCGDFNDTPISYTRRKLAQTLTDCFAETGRGLGLSYNQKGFWVRIDHILCSSDFTPYNCQVDSKIDFSDHYPIACQLKKGGK